MFEPFPHGLSGGRRSKIGRGKERQVNARFSAMVSQLDAAFPPSGNWLTFDGLPLNSQPPELLMQLIEFFFVRDGVMGSDPGADVRSAQVLKKELLARIGEIKTKDGLGSGPIKVLAGRRIC
jgi:hypothetical protein